jgi:hypothetical protein
MCHRSQSRYSLARLVVRGRWKRNQRRRGRIAASTISTSRGFGRLLLTDNFAIIDPAHLVCWRVRHGGRWKHASAATRSIPARAYRA